MQRQSHTPTRKDVAELAGVSETIVSYVINNNRYVAKDKRERVLRAVEQLHYRPNSIARALKGKGNSHILFIVDNVANEYFGRLVQEIESVAYDCGFLVSLMGVQNNHEYISRILSRQVDAVVISSASLEESLIQELIDAGLPVVLLMTRDYATLHGKAARIYTGIESGIMAAVRLLYESGCHRLVHVDRVSESGHFSNRQDLRYRGFCNQMESLGLPLSEQSFISQCRNYDELYEAVCRRLRQDEPADGFVCRNDRLACTVLEACRDCGRDVPGEVCITGFDNSSISQVVKPALTTLAHDQKGIARAVLDTIESMVHGEVPQDRHFLTRMVARGTTR
ncbi:MAG: LacI family DNA-binding transcriptional regulator [Aristaeellaceae bacterium]